MSWTTVKVNGRNSARNTTTGASTMREHRSIKRTQAEARNAGTPASDRKKNRVQS